MGNITNILLLLCICILGCKEEPKVENIYYELGELKSIKIHDTTDVQIITLEKINRAHRQGAQGIRNIYFEPGAVGDTSVLKIDHYTGVKLDSSTYHPGDTYKKRR